MNRFAPLGLRGLIPFLLLALIQAPEPAQGQEEPQSVTFAVYYTCNPVSEARADEIAQNVLGPIFQRHVQSGDLTGYGWLAHRIGAEWRRASYYAASDLDALLATRDQILDEARTDHPDELAEFNQICGTHVDYLWSQVRGSDPTSTPNTEGMVSLGSYFECDMAKEALADVLVRESIGDVYDRYVDAGRIASWSWMQHMMGGRVRRLLTMRGPDPASILNTWGELLQDLNTEMPDVMSEFSGICGLHDDYLWNVVVSSSN